jgi:hypothetical protein
MVEDMLRVYDTRNTVDLVMFVIDSECVIHYSTRREVEGRVLNKMSDDSTIMQQEQELWKPGTHVYVNITDDYKISGGVKMRAGLFAEILEGVSENWHGYTNRVNSSRGKESLRAPPTLDMELRKFLYL